MNTRLGTNSESIKSPMKHERESRVMDAENGTTRLGGSTKQIKMALQQDVDKLKKKLRHEENVHRALERAFTRPLGTLPRFPPYLPPYTLELVAEVAILEEEVVRLEEQVVHFRQGLYQEAVYISSSKRNLESSAFSFGPYPIKNSKEKQSKFSALNRGNLPTLSDKWCAVPTKNKSSPNSKVHPVKTPGKRPPFQCRPAERLLNPKNLQLESRIIDHGSEEVATNAIQGQRLSGVENPNRISENLVDCLSKIFLRMNTSKNRATAPLNSFEKWETVGFRDPYGICSEFGRRDIGPYTKLITVEASSINPNPKTKSMFLVCRLQLLLAKLASVNLKGLTRQEKLAFWINTYNSCMMNAFLEHGIPESPKMVVELMQKATVNVGGHLVDAITIEHFILRLPYHSNYTFGKGTIDNEMTDRITFGLELSEPLVTFALSCGSWSSPAVKVYTASEVENELEVAKKEYLQAAIGISTRRKLIVIPKLLDWYLLDFAKDLESLLDWICLQLPNEMGKQATKCLERGKDEPLSRFVKVMPYEFNFRYLLQA